MSLQTQSVTGIHDCHVSASWRAGVFRRESASKSGASCAASSAYGSPGSRPIAQGGLSGVEETIADTLAPAIARIIARVLQELSSSLRGGGDAPNTVGCGCDTAPPGATSSSSASPETSFTAGAKAASPEKFVTANAKATAPEKSVTTSAKAASKPVPISSTGLELIKRYEGFRSHAYQDSGGVWTIGYGHTKGVKSGQSITKAQGERYLKQDLSSAEADVARLVKGGLTQGQQDALVSFQFNTGGLAGSTLLRKLNHGDRNYLL